MLKTHVNDVKLVCARLVIDIEYVKDGLPVEVEKDTHILVDQDKGIALVFGDHVDIDASEYKVSQAN